MAGKRTIIVTQKNVIKSDVGTKGPWTLTGIHATTAEGEPIDEQLKTFDELPEGQPIEVEMERQNHDKFGTSYLITYRAGKRPATAGGGKGTGLGGSVDELRARVDALEARVQALEGGSPAPSPGSQSGRTQQDVHRRTADGPPPAAPPTSDDDIPF